jgi:hypothetical protein
VPPSVASLLSRIRHSQKQHKYVFRLKPQVDWPGRSRSAGLCSRAAEDPHRPVRVAEEDLVGVGEEEAEVDHARRLQGGGDRLEVAGREGAVEEVVALVGDERGPVGV